MAYFKLTAIGENFIRNICSTGGNKLLSGQAKKALPYTNPPLLKTWVCDIVDPKNTKINITTSLQLSEALIYWFNTYAKQYELDANIIAAQAYAESNYVMWAYSDANTSTASGVNQFLMLTVYGVIVDNEGKSAHMSPDEITEITSGLINPLSVNSYSVNSKNYQDAYNNRPILHQNIINNPGIMIKAQCRYMKNFADACGSLASTSLFCYSRGLAFDSNTYTKAIEKCQKKHGVNSDYVNEGLNYVLKIFGILGDKENWLQKNGKISSGYKPMGYYFGYDEQMGNNSPRNLKLKDQFDAFTANVTESDEFSLNKGFENDIVVKELSVNPKYKFISYPESDYYVIPTKKTQIVLHHTVSGDDVASDIDWWKNQVNKTGDKVATAFIVGRRGEIFQLYSTDYWAYHLGISSAEIKTYDLPTNTNKLLNEQSIGIEIDSWGGLIESGGNWYPATTDDYHPQQYVANTKVKPIKNVVEYNASNGYPNGFHGFYGFEKYTDDQIKAVREIILAIKDKFTQIPMGYANDIYPNTNMWGTYNNSTKKWEPEMNALQGKSGIWTHVSYRIDKSDCDPQLELINMLKSLK